MPIYEYKCTKCEETLEVLELKASDAKPVICCDLCNGLAHRIISRSTFKVNGANAANGYAATGKEVGLNDFDDAHKFNIRTTEERRKATGRELGPEDARASRRARGEL